MTDAHLSGEILDETEDDEAFSFDMQADEFDLDSENAPEWLSAIRDESAAEDEVQPVPKTDIPSWLSDVDVDEPESDEMAAEDVPDWLMDAAPVEEEPVAETDVPGWLSGIGDDSAAHLTDIDEAMYAEEEIAPVAAENAPDWLNAMVPGLDVDYEAEEDEPIEKEFVTRAQAYQPASSSQEFEWLTEIVEHEMNQPPETLPVIMPAAAQVQREKPRFVFSRPPVWLRDATPQLDLDDIGDDLPPWLDYEDFDEN